MTDDEDSITALADRQLSRCLAVAKEETRLALQGAKTRACEMMEYLSPQSIAWSKNDLPSFAYGPNIDPHPTLVVIATGERGTTHYVSKWPATEVDWWEKELRRVGGAANRETGLWLQVARHTNGGKDDEAVSAALCRLGHAGWEKFQENRLKLQKEKLTLALVVLADSYEIPHGKGHMACGLMSCVALPPSTREQLGKTEHEMADFIDVEVE
jgi:hypothetical protein